MCSTDVASATNPIDSASIFMGGKENPEMKHQINLFTDRAAIFILPPGHPRGQNQNGCCIGKRNSLQTKLTHIAFGWNCNVNNVQVVLVNFVLGWQR